MVKDLLALPPLEWGFPALQGIIEAPALRTNGTVIAEPGYDEHSRLFYAPENGLHLPEIPERPSDGDIGRAVKLISEILEDFPFVGHHSSDCRRPGASQTCTEGCLRRRAS
jgi:hypothetical protein